MANRENSREQDELSQSTEVEETYFEDSQYEDSEYGDSQYEDSEDEEENSSLFAMSEEELDDRPGVNWLSVLSAVVAVILSIVLAIAGVRAFASVNNNAEYAGKSWVIQGTYQDLTPDLITKGNVARYKGNLPADDALNGKTYVSNLKDKYQVTSGAPIEFRGSQTGDVPSEFPREVDGLLVEKGTLKPVTQDSVNAERFAGIASIVGAVLVLLLGLGFAVWLNRRSRDVEYEDLDGLVEDER